MSILASPEEARNRLEGVKAKRGYLLPHHGLLALTAPKLLTAYDEAYTALTLEPRTLDNHSKEMVWIAILVAANEGIASHHLKYLRNAGGTEEEIAVAIRLAAFGRSAPSFRFVEAQWQEHIPGFNRESAYCSALEALYAGQPVESGLVDMMMAAVHTCLYQHWELALHIRRAYACGVPEIELAEALSLTMFPASVPYFVEACNVWREMIRRGEVAASESLSAWAEMS